VTNAHNLLADHAGKYADIEICAETSVDVRFCLVGRNKKELKTLAQSSSTISLGASSTASNSPITSGYATPTANTPHPMIPKTAPLTSVRHIKKIYSHQMAWGQCKAFLDAYCRSVERQNVQSTSHAAQMVAEAGEDETGQVPVAALSSEIAANLYGLDILAKDVEDMATNETRFYVLRKKKDKKKDMNDDQSEQFSSAGNTDGNITSNSVPKKDETLNTETASTTNSATAATSPQEKSMRYFKTLVTFTIDRDAPPGALSDALAIFKHHSINLTSLCSLPSGLANWHYIFFLEFVTNWIVEDETDGVLKDVLDDLAINTKSRRWWGTWEIRGKEGGLGKIEEDKENE
jgi:prephenate dehydratase